VILKKIGELGYKIEDSNSSDFLVPGGKYENFFRENEKVYLYLLFGKR